MLSPYISLCFLGLVVGVSAAPAVPTAHEDGFSSLISSKHHTVTVTETVLVTLVQTASVHPPGPQISTRTTNLPAAPPSISETRRFTINFPHAQISTRTTYLPAAPPSVNSSVRTWPPFNMNTAGSNIPAAPPSMTSTTHTSLKSQITPTFVFDPLPESSTWGNQSASVPATTAPVSSSAITTPAAAVAVAAANNQSDPNDEEVHIYPVGWESTHYPQKTISGPPSDATTQIQSSSTSTDILDPVAWDMTNPNARRSESNNASRRKKAFWTQFFALASPAYPGRSQIVRDEDEEQEAGGGDESKCVVCPKGRDMVCIGKTHFGFCDEGCAEPRRLTKGTKCVKGRIHGV